MWAVECFGCTQRLGLIGIELHLASLVDADHILSNVMSVLSYHVVSWVDADLHRSGRIMSDCPPAQIIYHCHQVHKTSRHTAAVVSSAHYSVMSLCKLRLTSQ